MPRCPKPRYTKKYVNWDEVPLFLSVEDVCILWELSDKTILNMLNSGSLKGFKVGDRWRIPKESVQNYGIEQ